MEFNIPKHPKAGYLFKDLKEWFSLNMNELPQMVNGKEIIQYEIKSTVKLWIESIEAVEDPRKSERAKHCKRMLGILYDELQNKDNWNKPPKDLGTVKLV